MPIDLDLMGFMSYTQRRRYDAKPPTEQRLIVSTWDSAWAKFHELLDAATPEERAADAAFERRQELLGSLGAPNVYEHDDDKCPPDCADCAAGEHRDERCPQCGEWCCAHTDPQLEDCSAKYEHRFEPGGVLYLDFARMRYPEEGEPCSACDHVQSEHVEEGCWRRGNEMCGCTEFEAAK